MYAGIVMTLFTGLTVNRSLLRGCRRPRRWLTTRDLVAILTGCAASAAANHYVLSTGSPG